ncbi:hypothetical protein BJY01DRAFT_135790 [Aspergillus pseudoustus]|uniref:AMP-dependent synthetase/ligase domain-containing protein n=1 Tax=Aspergillus pseudoustus TaxID=1810923 RepID=A0ABR4IIT6_9EURO
MYQRTVFSAARRTHLSKRQIHPLFTCKACTTRLDLRRSLGTLPNIPLFQALKSHDPSSLAIVATEQRFTYGNLLADVLKSREEILRKAGDKPNALQGERIAFLSQNCYDWLVMLLSILASDAIAVPLNPSYPTSELKYVMDNSQAGMLITTVKYLNKTEALLNENLERTLILNVWEKIMTPAALSESVKLDGLDGGHGGLMLYTSGTTNRPKGVLIPQSALAAQAASLIQAWNYTPQDHLLHILPLHHIHGIVNALLTPLIAGSSVELQWRFKPDDVWRRLAAPFLPEGDPADKITFLNSVPTMYHRLLDIFPTMLLPIQQAAKKAVSTENLRLNVSGSASLPTPIKKGWETLTGGNVLLERYGMTEVGMALSCGLDFADRVDASVGWPLPSVDVRLVDTDTNEVIKPGEELDANGRPRQGEIQLRGPTLFTKYWANEVATKESFVDSDDGKGPWFKTGDIATRQLVEGSGKGTSGEWAKGPMYFIQGRQSVDIIKSGAEKISALEVERELLSLPQIKEAAVVGIPHQKWGEKLVAIVVLNAELAAKTGHKGYPWNAFDMWIALKPRLARHKIPMEMKVLHNELPRNAMGKSKSRHSSTEYWNIADSPFSPPVNKKQLIRDVFGDVSLRTGND